MTIDQDFDELESDIKLTVGDDCNSAGFHPIFCPVCGNSGIKKGGFKFESDKIVYNCFRASCDATCVYTKGEYIPKKFKQLMELLGVDIPLTLRMVNTKKHRKLFEEVDERFVKNSYKNFTFPSKVRNLTSKDYHWLRLIEDRHLIDYDFSVVDEGKYKGCLMAPMILDGVLLGVQIITKSGRYIKETNNSHIIFSPSEVIRGTVIVVEGFMDALSLPNTVAVMGKNITREQAFHLNRAKEVIVLPDKGNERLVKDAGEYGWKVALPKWYYKDLNKAVSTRGRLWAARMIRESTYESNANTNIARYRLWNRETER